MDVITNDKDFGEESISRARAHRGIIFMRLEDERAANKIQVLQLLLESHADRFEDQFVVVTKHKCVSRNPEPRLNLYGIVDLQVERVERELFADSRLP